jgi:hypothetical protein
MEPQRTWWCNRAVRIGSSLAVVSLVLMLIGCSNSRSGESRSTASTLEVGSDDAEPAGGSKASAVCRVTIPTRSVKPGADLSAGAFNFGNRDLRAHLYWPQGRLTAGVLPDGGAMAIINADGSIAAKVGWWRGMPGRLVISGRRLDGEAPPLRADVPVGYGSQGFQPTGLTFSTTGCWEVTGKVGDAELMFVVTVSKITT